MSATYRWFREKLYRNVLYIYILFILKIKLNEHGGTQFFKQ